MTVQWTLVRFYSIVHADGVNAVKHRAFAGRAALATLGAKLFITSGMLALWQHRNPEGAIILDHGRTSGWLTAFNLSSSPRHPPDPTMLAPDRRAII